jgi:hypothetical protein
VEPVALLSLFFERQTKQVLVLVWTWHLERKTGDLPYVSPDPTAPSIHNSKSYEKKNHKISFIYLYRYMIVAGLEQIKRAYRKI